MSDLPEELRPKFTPEDAEKVAAQIDEEPAEAWVPPPPENACFPIDSSGMPVALNEIPLDERSFFWRDNLYRNFPIARVPVQAPEHKHLFDGSRWGGRDRSFYVRKEDTVGLVVFPNAQVTWPHEAGWTQDLHFARLEREAEFKKALQKRLKEKT